LAAIAINGTLPARVVAQSPCNFRTAWDIHLVPVIAKVPAPRLGASYPRTTERAGAGSGPKASVGTD